MSLSTEIEAKHILSAILAMHKNTFFLHD